MAAPLYAGCALLVLLPAVDLLTNVWPIRPWEIGWRYGTVGLASGFLLTPLLGLMAAAVLARLLDQSAVLRALAAVVGLTALALAGATGMFVLDALEVSGQIPADGREAFQIGAVRAVLKNALVAGVLGWMALATLRAATRSG